MSQLEQLPDSIIAHICHFVNSTDLLQFRISSTKILAFLLTGDEANVIWRNELAKEFAFELSASNYLQTLGIHPQWRERHNGSSQSQRRTSIFGYDFSEEGGVFTAASAFESWKHWSKATNIFLLNSNDDEDSEKKINGPYFLRAANIWRIIDQWCRSDISGEFGYRLLNTFVPGVRRSQGRFFKTKSKVEAVHAFESIFAFCDGQLDFSKALTNSQARVTHVTYIALFGGYSVYDHTNFMRLCATDNAKLLTQHQHEGHFSLVPISFNYDFSHLKCIAFKTDSGMLHLMGHGPGDFWPAYSGNDCYDTGLLWMEEHARRLENGLLEISTKVGNGISVLSSFPSAQSTFASRRVTHGIEVIASSVAAVEIKVVAYSIRIRILAEGEYGYKTPAERGFETCQLQSRQLRIYDSELDAVDQVSGDGVVGLYPLLREGGYRDDEQNRFGEIARGEEMTGIFQYQSCARIIAGTFKGRMKFISGSVTEPTGDAFFVEIGEIALNLHPDISY